MVLIIPEQNLNFFKTVPFCSPTEEDEACLEKMAQRKHGCLTSCSGLHADVERKDESLMNLYKENRKSTSESFEKVSDVLSTGKEKLLH